MCAIMTKVFYSVILLRFRYIPRYCIGIVASLVGVTFLYFGIETPSLVCVYLSAAFIAFGNVVLYLTSLAFLKHFPSEYLSTYLIGDYGGGMLITVVYFIFSHLSIPFEDVPGAGLTFSWCFCSSLSTFTV